MGVLGVDGCRAGWFGVVLADHDQILGVFGPSLDELVSAASRVTAVEVVAVDMPIGLPDSGSRRADVLARKFVGRRAPSVFPTPVRGTLAGETHAEASALSRELSGKGLSQQAFALKSRLLEVEDWVRRSTVPVIEVHPEVCFAEMAGSPLDHSKHQPEGLVLRRSLLEGEGISVPNDLWAMGRVAAADDVLDAAAAAWTGRRFAQGLASSMPDPPEVFSDGLDSAIWR